MLTVVIVLKALVEIAAFSLIAQGLLFLFAGATRERNPIYKFFALLNRPVWKATRFVTPRFIVDPHVGFVSFFLLAVLWVVLVVAKIHFYLSATQAPA
jgi:hypothetical protein